MPESLLSRRLKLGTYAGIPLYVHWSFGLLILFVSLHSVESGLAVIAFSIAQLFGVFFCVILHEYGHSLTARRFGIGTADITLLPIGGVARLKEMPRVPWQELVVAVAGPAVNVIIAGILGTLMYFAVDHAILDAFKTYFAEQFGGAPPDIDTEERVMDLLSPPSWLAYGITMLAINLMLVLFNMVPAFPMDGGRVLRSLLAMTMNYQKATRIALKVGAGCALLMAFLALGSGNWMLLLISGFITYAGLAEYRQVNVTETIRDLRVKDVMVPTSQRLSMDSQIEQMVTCLRRQLIPAAPVVSSTGLVVGVLTIEDVLEELERNPASLQTAGQLINHGAPIATVRGEEPLSDAIRQVDRKQRHLAVVDAAEQLIGILDLDSMMSRAKLHHASTAMTPEENGHFDAVS